MKFFVPLVLVTPLGEEERGDCFVPESILYGPYKEEGEVEEVLACLKKERGYRHFLILEGRMA